MSWELIVSIGGTVGAIAVIGGAVVGVFKGCRGVLRMGRRATHFFDDWNGEDARDGQPAKPGVLVRLQSVEKELKPNGGSTLKDAVTRLEANVTGVADQLADNSETLQTIGGTVSTLDQRVAALEASRSASKNGKMRRKP